jgi:hypothetical protein
MNKFFNSLIALTVAVLLGAQSYNCTIPDRATLKVLRVLKVAFPDDSWPAVIGKYLLIFPIVIILILVPCLEINPVPLAPVRGSKGTTGELNVISYVFKKLITGRDSWIGYVGVVLYFILTCIVVLILLIPNPPKEGVQIPVAPTVSGGRSGAPGSAYGAAS